MYEELPRRLKTAADRYEKEHPIIGVGELRPQDAMQDAACAIESLTAQVTALQAENGSKDKEIIKLKMEKELMRQEWDTSQAALSRVEAERDAAVMDLCLAGDCDTCYMRGKRGYSQCSPAVHDENGTCVGYKWRGAQGVEGQE